MLSPVNHSDTSQIMSRKVPRRSCMRKTVVGWLQMSQRKHVLVFITSLQLSHDGGELAGGRKRAGDQIEEIYIFILGISYEGCSSYL